MQKRMLCVGILLGLTAGVSNTLADDKTAEEAVKKELAALKGEWKITSRIEDGKETPAETIKNRVITFEEAKYVIKDGEEIFAQSAFKIDPSKDPKWFDLPTAADDSDYKGKPILGIYKIDGDTVTFCLATAVGSARPTDFTAKKDSGHILTTYKRVKK